MPSVFTTFNLFLGYLALIQIIKKNYITAAYFIVFAVVMDGFDGTIARLTKTESNFGMQLDSLVDAVTFGLVTSIMIYNWGFQTMPAQFGQIIGFIFLSAGVIRLARFNVYTEAKALPSNIFIGLPIPLAALAIVSLILMFEDPVRQEKFALYLAMYVVILSFLMISNIRYRTLKKINPKYSLLLLFIMATIVALSIKYPGFTIPILAFLYVISPLILWVFKLVKKRKKTTGVEKKSG